MKTYIMILATMALSITPYNGVAREDSETTERTFKHGFSVSTQIGDATGDVSGKHNNYDTYNGSNPEAITPSNATILDGIIEDSRSFGYNVRYIPKTGWGFEVDVSRRTTAFPKQQTALKHDDGSAFKRHIGGDDLVVDSPASEIKTVDIYFGGIYRFTAVKNITPYIGAGYAKTKGVWTKSYYEPGDDENYGTKGETDVKGSSTSFKIGLDLNNGFSLEWQQFNNKLKADSFRSFNIDGADADYKIDTLQLLYHF